MAESETLLGGLSVEDFLTQHWQKKPLFVPGAFPELDLKFNGSELAGLACEPETHSRIVIEKGGESPWQVSLGPFEETAFQRLPKTHWTLLVQQVDHYIPEISGLKDHFRFIPDWRMDDVMVSFAVEGGGVGPHLDQYDVFLLQAKGRRKWSIESKRRMDDHFIEGLDVRILQEFQPDQEWETGPGDLLYLPPGFPHCGVALGDCLTVSIGFRAPSVADLVMAKAEHLVETQPESNRYADPDLGRQAHPSEITPAAVERVKKILQALSDDDAFIARWFGELVTQTQSAERESQRDASAGSLVRSLSSRIAYYRASDRILVFADGHSYSVPLGAQGAVESLCRKGEVPLNEIEPAYQVEGFQTMLDQLVEAGVFSRQD